jgi:hypothetical protein
VRLAHVLGVHRVHAQDLRTRTRTHSRMQPLSTLLFGQPLSQRGEDNAAEVAALGRSLDRVLRGAIDLLGRETGEGTEAFAQAKMEWENVLASEHDYAGIAARRAALLFALHTLPPVRRHYAQAEPELVNDLERRVLPAVVPAFLAGMAQRPEALVVLTSTLSSMWREPMGEEGAVPGAPPRQGKQGGPEQGEGARA